MQFGKNYTTRVVRVGQVKRFIITLKMTGERNMRENVLKLLHIVDNLSEINLTIIEDQLTILLLWSIRNGYGLSRNAKQEKLPLSEVLK